MNKCACKGSFLDRFLQPSVLLLLKDKELHGFSLYKELLESDLMDYTSLDPTGFYRTLKRMEDAGLLLSRWDKTKTQSRKRYTVSEEGLLCLASWEKTLLSYKKEIGRLAKAIHENLEKDGN